MRRWPWARGRQELERQELGIIQLGGKDRTVAVRRKLQNVTRWRKCASLGDKEIAASVEGQPSRPVEVRSKRASYSIRSKFKDGVGAGWGGSLC